MEGALQELDETAYWLELLLELQVVDQSYLNDLLHETDELTAIFVTTVRNVKSRRKP
jgi:four helix bundle protein